ncbi:NAD(P)H-hydrate epimerase [Candidatus Woesearchaeota archaeon]|nr:MAG: NAD(P)H-hydrate epimerase [Candidatus Woesearchaeota archaeon]
MIPYVNRRQIAELDRLMVEHFKVSVEMMMEHAGYRIAEFIRKKFPGKKRVLICVGKGNNGGDGISAARHLRNFGYEPVLFLMSPDLTREGLSHLEIARILKVPELTSVEMLKHEIRKADVIIDCLIGYNLKGAPRKDFVGVIKLINQSSKPIVACDVPSGIDTDKGAVHDTYVKATHIIFLSLPKIGCKDFPAEKFVADIGVPKELYSKIGVKPANYFRKSAIIKI